MIFKLQSRSPPLGSLLFKRFPALIGAPVNCRFASRRLSSGADELNRNNLVPSASRTMLLNNQHESIANPWRSVSDPKGSGMIYWHNSQTNETTHLG